MTRTSTRPSTRHRLARIVERLFFLAAASALIGSGAGLLFWFGAALNDSANPDAEGALGAVLAVAVFLLLIGPHILTRSTVQHPDETRAASRVMVGTIIGGPAGVELTPTGIQFLLEDPDGTYLVTHEPATAPSWLAARLGQPGTRVRITTRDTPVDVAAAPIHAETLDLLTSPTESQDEQNA